MEAFRKYLFNSMNYKLIERC